MINPDFDKITQWLEENNIAYGINTNGVVLKKCNADYVKVSLDGYDIDSYKSIKGIDAYEIVRQNIKDFAKWKSEKTLLGVQKIVTDVDEIERFYQSNKDLPFDYMVFRPIESTDGKYYEQDRQVEDCIEKIQGLKDDRIILNYKWRKIGVKFDKCEAHWSQIALDENGNVLYCCHKPYEIVGHILDDDIMIKYEQAQTNMRLCDVPCRLTAPNELMVNLETIKNVDFI